MVKVFSVNISIQQISKMSLSKNKTDGKKFDKSLIKLEKIGDGGFGDWYSMLHKDSGLIIVKKVSKVNK